MPTKDGLPVPEPDIFSASCGCSVRIHCQVARVKERACVVYTQRKECFDRQMGRVLSLDSCKLSSEVRGALSNYASQVQALGWTLVAEPRDLN